MDNIKSQYHVRRNLSIMFFTKSIVFLFILCVLSIIEAINHGSIPSYIAVMLIGLSTLYLYIGIALSTYRGKGLGK